MSNLSGSAKDILEPSIRRDERKDYDTRDIVTMAAFIFLKAAVLEWGLLSRKNVRLASHALPVLRFAIRSFVMATTTLRFRRASRSGSLTTGERIEWRPKRSQRNS